VALLACRECGTEISKSAKACPKCGAPGPRQSFSLRRVLITVAVCFAIIVISAQWWGSKGGDVTLPWSGPRVVVKETVQIEEDKYVRWIIEADGQVEVKVRVADGPAVDVYFVDAARFDDYIKKEKFYFYPALSQSSARRFEASGSMRPGKYALIVDNTDYGGTSPPMNMVNDRATVEVEVKAK